MRFYTTGPSSPRRAATIRHLLAFNAVMLCFVAHTAAGQADKKTLNVSANVSDVGIVINVSALTWYDRLVTGDIKVAGTVRTTHNGGYALQARLSTAIADTVLGKTPNGTYSMLSTTAWVTLTTGPGGTNKTNAVDFWVKWAKSSRKKPEDAEAIPVTYRVVAF
jgi:hypothetical protein